MNNVGLPEFLRPPVVETVLGVQFDRIEGLTNAHLGVFWETLNANDPGRWPDVKDAPIIDDVREYFGPESAWLSAGSSFRIQLDPSCRLRITNADKNAMVQVQNSRLHYNWIGLGENYPRYERIRPEFDSMWDRFHRFLQTQNLSAPRPNQWEITYVNHIERGTVWNEPSDWPRLFPGLPGVWSEPSSVRLESLQGVWHFRMPDNVGRLHIEIQHLSAGETGKERIRLTLTARGPIENTDDYSTSLNAGRTAIVKSFRDITSADAHKFWGLKQ